MSKNLVTVNEKADLTLCAKLMIDNKISSIIVTDDKGTLKGIFTKSDLVEGYGKYYSQKAIVEGYMSKKVLTVRPDEPLHMVLLLMTREKVSEGRCNTRREAYWYHYRSRFIARQVLYLDLPYLEMKLGSAQGSRRNSNQSTEKGTNIHTLRDKNIFSSQGCNEI